MLWKERFELQWFLKVSKENFETGLEDVDEVIRDLDIHQCPALFKETQDTIQSEYIQLSAD